MSDPMPLQRARSSYSWRWVSNRFVEFARTSFNAFLLTTISTGFVGYLGVRYTSVLVVGLIYYCIEYARSALGDDERVGACFNILHTGTIYEAWGALDTDSFNFYLRCRGNEDGFTRYELLLDMGKGGVSGHIIESPLLALAIIFSIRYSFPQFSRLFYRFYNTLEQGYHQSRLLWAITAVLGAAIKSYSNIDLSVHLALMFYPITQGLQVLCISIARIAKKLEFILDIRNWAGLLEYARVKDQIEKAKADLANARSNITSLETKIDGLKAALRENIAEANTFRECCIETHTNIVQPASGLSLPAELFSNESSHDLGRAQSRIRDLEDEARKYREERRMLNIYNDSLKARVNYAHSVDEDRSASQAEFVALKSQIRKLERELQQAHIEGMQWRQAYAKERELQTDGCHNEAMCQREIRQLQSEKDLLMESHVQNYKDVQEAALLFGLPKEEAQHVDLKSYLVDVTTELIRLRNAASGAIDNNDVGIEIYRRHAKEDSAYKIRLEKEIVRLGGDFALVAARQGLSPHFPMRHQGSFITYQEESYRVFRVYGRICTAVRAMEQILAQGSLPVPDWDIEASRTDTTNNRVNANWTLDIEQRYQSNDTTNPTASNHEALVHRLTLAEMQRWYNRSFQLRQLVKSIALQSGNTLSNSEDAVTQLLNDSQIVMREVLIDVLDDTSHLIKSDKLTKPLTKVAKQFEIYHAFQAAISSLSKSIVDNRRDLPRWLPYNIRNNTHRATPALLGINLIKRELKYLKIRLEQLLLFVDEERFPGASTGPPPASVQNDPEYEHRWKQLVASRGYAHLALSHWRLYNDRKEIDDPRNPGHKIVVPDPEEVNLLPLKIDEYRRTILGIPKKEQPRNPEEWNPDLTAHLWRYDDRGPVYEFRIMEHDNDSWNGNHENDDKNSTNRNSANRINNINNNNNGNEFQKAKDDWEKAKRRVKQLEGFLRHSNKFSQPIGSRFTENMPKNSNAGWLRKKTTEELLPLVRKYTSMCTNNGLNAPKEIHNGGPRYGA